MSKNSVPASVRGGTATQVQYDEGLRKFMLGIYNHMIGGLILTALSAYAALTVFADVLFTVGANGAMVAGMGMWVLMGAGLLLMIIMAVTYNRLSPGAAKVMFFTYSAITGATLAPVALVYTSHSIVMALLSAVVTFGVASIYGYTTKKDLTNIGGMLIVGLIALIIVSLINIFIGSTLLEMGISLAGIAIFLGLTAYDTQRIKSVYDENLGTGGAQKYTAFAALGLYLNLVNLFLYFLRLRNN